LKWINPVQHQEGAMLVHCPL